MGSESNSDAADVGVAGVVVLVGTAISMFGGLVLRLVIARNATQEVLGLIALFLAFLDVISIACVLGLDRGVVRYIPATESEESRNVYITLAIVVPFVIGTIFMLFVMQFNSLIANSVMESNTTVVFILGLSIPVYASTRTMASVFRGTMDTRTYVIYNKISEPGLKILFVGVVLMLTTSAAGVSSAIAVAFWSLAVFGLYLLKRSGWSPVYSITGNVRGLFAYSLPLLLASSIYRFLTYFDKFAIGYYIDASSVGVYEVALTISGLLGVFYSSFSFLIFPKVSELDASAENERIRRMYRQTTKFIMIFTVPLFVAIIHRPDFLVRIFGDQYQVSTVGPALSIVSIGILSNTIVGPNSETLLGFGRSKTILAYNVLSVLVNIVLNVLLIPGYGLVGAAVALLCGYGVMNVLKSADLYVNYGILVLEGKSTLVSVLLVIVSWPASQVLPATRTLVQEFAVLLAYSGGIFALGLGGLYLVGGITEDDIEAIRQIWPDDRL